MTATNYFLFGGMTGEKGQFTCPNALTSPGDFPTESERCTFLAPQEAKDCDDLKDVTGLTMIWDGLAGVNIVTAYDEEFPNVNPGDIITFRADTRRHRQ